MGQLGSALRRYFTKFTDHELKLYDPHKGLLHDTSDADISFICVPANTNPDGSQDLNIIKDAVARAGGIKFIRSTVLPGTNDMLGTYSMPEFLTERTAYEDVCRMDVMTSYNNYAVLSALFPKKKFLIMTNMECELAKYAHNAFGAMKVNFANIIYDIADKLGADYRMVKAGMLLSGYINDQHLEVPGPDGAFGYGGTCVHPYTRILKPGSTCYAYELKVGDTVLDREATTTITKMGSRLSEFPIQIKSKGRKLTASHDHIHFIYKDNELKETTVDQIRPGDFVFVKRPVIDGVVDVNLGPKPNNHVKVWHETLKLDFNLARVMGLYSADGYMTNDKYATQWSFGLSKAHLADEVIQTLSNYGLHATKRYVETAGTFGLSKCFIVRCRSQWLQAVINSLELGTGAFHKSCKLFSGDIALGFISGWLDGDGCLNQNTVSGYSRSKILINNIDTMLLSLGVCASIKDNGEEIRISCKDDVNLILKYTKRLNASALEYKRSNSYKSPNTINLPNGWATMVKEVKHLEPTEVISIETESHTYIANNMLTHNCFPKDLRALNHLFPTKSFEACMAENRNHRSKRGRQESTLDRDNSTTRPVVVIP